MWERFSQEGNSTNEKHGQKGIVKKPFDRLLTQSWDLVLYRLCDVVFWDWFFEMSSSCNGISFKFPLWT